MNLGDTADIEPELMERTGYRTKGARCLSKKMSGEDTEPDIISRILGKDLDPGETGPISILVPDDNVVTDILDGRSYRYVDGSYQRPEDVLEFFDEVASSERDQSPELVFPNNIIDRLHQKYTGEDRLEIREVKRALDDLGSLVEVHEYWDRSVHGSQRGDAMICNAASELAPEGSYALAMTNDDHFRRLAREHENVIEASPVYTMKTVREKGLIR